MSKKIFDFLKLIRINNLLIIGATQIFAYFFLTPSITIQHLIDTDFIKLLVSTFLVAGAGYIINDYMDVMLDLVNKPDKVIVGKSISRRWAMFLHLIMNLVAFLLAYSINKKIAILVLGASIFLWIYSQLLKKTFLSGNILVALLTAFTLWILFLFDPNIMSTGIWVYGIFSFLTTIIREIIKDTEDLSGDKKFKAKTLPIVLGVRKTKSILLWAQLLLIVLTIGYCISFETLSISGNKIYFMFLVFMLILVLTPMVYMAKLIYDADVKKDFTRLSFISKLVMLFGIISMVFWRV
jgi:4-hydroxybenzoate polyprenyltransferase